MEKELKELMKRFDIAYTNDENEEKFRNALVKILENNIGNITLHNFFREIFIKYTGIDYSDGRPIDFFTEIDYGQRNVKSDCFGANYIKFEQTCIGKAFKKGSLSNIIKYLQVIFLMPSDIISASEKNKLCKEINEVADLFCIDIVILKTSAKKYLLYPRGAKELDNALVNDMLNWLNEYPKVKALYEKAIEKYAKKEDIRNIIDDLRLSLELLMKEIFKNKKSLENNAKEILKFLRDGGISKEISNMYYTLLENYTKYQNNNVKHDNNCYEAELEYMLYLTRNIHENAFDGAI
ncbi:MAG: hypothetical protein IKJ32_06130 [Clostridia bacterium]|nr:hypothetical protein [Clostridia bacterium]